MYQFSQSSKTRLYTAHPELIEVFEIAILVSPIDFGIACGMRNRENQEAAFKTGVSQVNWPDSKHNRTPSDAVDFFESVGNDSYNDVALIHFVAGLIMGIANSKGYKFRWGGAWNGTLNKENQFNDIVHIERIGG